MEPKFINQYQITLEVYQQWAKHPVGNRAVRARKKGIRLRVMLACCGVFLLLDGLLIREFFLMMCGFLFFLLALFRLFVLPNRLIKSQYQMILKAQNRDYWVRTVTFSDGIVSEDGNGTTRYAYSDMIKITEDHNYFYLFSNEDMVLRIHKAGFLLGTPDEFREFCRGGIFEKADTSKL